MSRFIVSTDQLAKLADLAVKRESAIAEVAVAEGSLLEAKARANQAIRLFNEHIVACHDTPAECQAESTSGTGRVCELVHGHDGQHMASNDEGVGMVWP